MNPSVFYILLLVLSIISIVVLTTKFQLHPFLALLLVALGFGIFSGMPLALLAKSVNDGFGETLGKIGLVIILGVIIGEFLEKSGGAFAMAEWVLKIIGRKRIAAAMSFIGWIISIPVFADSGYIIISPLTKSLSKRAGISVTGPGIALALGLVTTHCMIPPTPGPIGAAGILNASLGKVILLGLPVSFIAMLAGLLYSARYASRVYVDPAPEITEDDIKKMKADSPSAGLSFVPILLPIVLIVIKSFISVQKDLPPSFLLQVLSFIGEPVVALLLGMFVALALPKKLERKMLSTTGWVGNALTGASIILLITGAGGVFGKVLQNSPIGEVLGQSLTGVQMGLLLPFLLSSVLKIAQGSSTVAMITAASLLSPLMSSLGFDSDTGRAMVVIAIAAGSMVVSHANDSLFWVVVQLNRMNVQQGFRLYTLGTLVIGATAMLVLLLISWFV